MNAYKYIPDTKAAELITMYGKFRNSEDYTYRKKQRAFCAVARDVLQYMVGHDKFNEDTVTMLVHLFKVNPSEEYIKEKLNLIADTTSDYNMLLNLFKQCEYRGFTAVGRTKIFLNKRNAQLVGDFIFQIFKDKSIEEIKETVKDFDAKNIMYCTAGIYSPWLHYIHPNICPIVNGQIDGLLSYLEIPKSKKTDYPYMLDVLTELKGIVNAEDFSVLDKFIYLTDFFKNITMKTEECMKTEQYINILRNNYNIVLTGAPGTGKTFMAQAIAEEMGCSKDEMCFVQFHPSYDYTDFVEGLRPITDGKGGIGFERKDGVFKEFCKRALSKVQPKVHKTISKQQNSFVGTTPFEKAYRKLIYDINAGSAVLYSDFRSNMTAMKLTIDNNQEPQIIKYFVSNDYRKAQYDYLRRLYNHFYSSGVFNIKNEKREEFEKIIGNTLDYSCYRGIVQGLLDRTDNGQDVIHNEQSTEQDIADVPIDVANRPYVFIIDEINRGEISKIFGELFYAIDPGYRGEKGRVKTQYQNLIPESDVFADGFYVPDNVYIIGTMNDIDRSVESMDFAMRRRFTWKEVTPADTQSMLDSLECADEAKNTMNRLNEEIANTDGLGAAYMVGPAYFLKLGNNGGNFERLWSMNIEPLLKEYLRGFRKAEDILKKFKKAYFKSEELPIEQEESDELE